ncbi:polysaccharide biosynthesis/export family protein [Phaeovulum sp.]|uniref:polysaccharide biosynthesis/export family protein n=1 Tax=Phaeovulum sp. TaxID=2934796 RepID=UPI0039E68C4D
MKRVFIIMAALVCAALPAAAQDGYRIKPGDLLRVEVLEDSNLNRNVLVLPDGNIALPMAGTVQASGQTVAQVQNALAAKLGPNFATPPNVYVGVDRLAEPRAETGTARAVPVISIYVMGEAAKPGKYDLTRGSTLLQALAATGGFSKFAATKRIQLRRGSAVYNFDYKAMEQGKVGISNTRLIEGDVIVIPQRRLFE